MADNCLFCRIPAGEIPGDKVYEDADILAFQDINPQAEADERVAGKMIRMAADIAKKEGFADYRLVFNNGAGAGQTVFHLHMHIIGGRPLGWPPG